ncbi:hypothetical protein FVE85_8188 [Porphyridium purpureum]|uniref:Uncharacterized protein n=1 Tax=Porphyridium purpureum TaxID=35688 RepID=A0A5J4YMG4_PORPP|nr:hypothetical protein FVE85_8188 [Porphyridium purpureum]|eukprot:POR6844..scf295_9
MTQKRSDRGGVFEHLGRRKHERLINWRRILRRKVEQLDGQQLDGFQMACLSTHLESVMCDNRLRWGLKGTHAMMETAVTSCVHVPVMDPIMNKASFAHGSGRQLLSRRSSLDAAALELVSSMGESQGADASSTIPMAGRSNLRLSVRINAQVAESGTLTPRRTGAPPESSSVRALSRTDSLPAIPRGLHGLEGGDARAGIIASGCLTQTGTSSRERSGENSKTSNSPRTLVKRFSSSMLVSLNQTNSDGQLSALAADMSAVSDGPNECSSPFASRNSPGFMQLFDELVVSDGNGGLHTLGELRAQYRAHGVRKLLVLLICNYLSENAHRTYSELMTHPVVIQSEFDACLVVGSGPSKFISQFCQQVGEEDGETLDFEPGSVSFVGNPQRELYCALSLLACGETHVQIALRLCEQRKNELKDKTSSGDSAADQGGSNRMCSSPAAAASSVVTRFEDMKRLSYGVVRTGGSKDHDQAFMLLCNDSNRLVNFHVR